MLSGACARMGDRLPAEIAAMKKGMPCRSIALIPTGCGINAINLAGWPLPWGVQIP